MDIETKILTDAEYISLVENDQDRDVNLALNRIIAHAVNAEREYDSFAHHAKGVKLSSMALDCKHQASNFATDLQRLVIRLGGDPKTGENFIGFLHRQWSKVRVVVEHNSDIAIVEEMMRLVETMRVSLAKTLERSDLPTEARNLLQAEYNLYDSLHVRLDEVRMAVEPVDFVDITR